MYITANSSGEQSGNTLIMTGPCLMTGLQVVTDGTNDGKVVIQDGVTAAGTVKCEMSVVGANHYGGRNWVAPIKFSTGIYVTGTGTGATYFVETASP